MGRAQPSAAMSFRVNRCMCGSSVPAGSASTCRGVNHLIAVNSSSSYDVTVSASARTTSQRDTSVCRPRATPFVCVTVRKDGAYR